MSEKREEKKTLAEILIFAEMDPFKLADILPEKAISRRKIMDLVANRNIKREEKTRFEANRASIRSEVEWYELLVRKRKAMAEISGADAERKQTTQDVADFIFRELPFGKTNDGFENFFNNNLGVKKEILYKELEINLPIKPTKPVKETPKEKK